MKLKAPLSCEVRMTENKGWGVFATNFIAKDSVIEECYLITIPKSGIEYDSTLFEDYRFNWPQGSNSIEQTLPLGFGCVYNHSNDNNAFWRDHPEYERVFQFVANRNIYPGEEICTWYGGSSYWDERSHIKVV